MSIQVKNLTKVYGEQKAVNDISFSVGSGEVVGFLGPNGAGKSTTMKMITGFIPSTEGIAEVCGIPVHENPIQARKKIGYLPESNPLYLDMFVKEYLEFVGHLQGMKSGLKARITEMIDRTGLGIEQKKKIGQLSKGYKQRVGLAQALLHDPEVLILDEPTSGLDANQIIEIRRLIQSIGQEKTIMLSTHIMQEVEALCQRVIIINRGVLQANDEVGSLKKMMKGNNILFLEFKGEAPVEDLKNIPGILKIQKKGKGLELEVDANSDPREAIFNWCKNQNLILLGMQLRENTLEEVFQEITSHA